MKIFGLSSVLMNESGGESGGGGSSAVATTTGATPSVAVSVPDSGGDASLATTSTDGAQDLAGADSTPAKFRAMEGKRLSSTAGAILKTAEDAQPDHRAFFRTVIPRALSVYSTFKDKYGSWEPINDMRDVLVAIGRSGNSDPLKTVMQNAVDRINAYEAQSADVDDSDALFAAGDPKLLAKMTEHKTADGKVDEYKTSAARAAMVKLCPHAVALWNQIAPKSYSRYFAEAAVRYMKHGMYKGADGKEVDEFDLPRRMARALALIPKADKDGNSDNAAVIAFANEAADVLEWVNAYIQDVQKMSRWGVEDLTPKAPAPELEIERLKAERTAERDARWVSERHSARRGLLFDSYRLAVAGRDVTPAQMGEIFTAVDSQSNIGLKGLADYVAKRDAFVASGDEAGFKNLYLTYFKEAIPRLMKEHVGKVLGKLSARPAAKTTHQAGASPSPQVGVKQVQDGPKGRNDYYGGPAGLIPGFASNADMIMAHQCIAAPGNHWGVPAGTKVRW